MKKLPPPVLTIAGFGLIWLLNQFIPIVEFNSDTLKWLGWVVIALSILLTLASVRLFAKAHTTLAPHKNPDKLIIGGPYKISRNPMYLALTGLLVGVALLLGGLSGFLIPVVFVIIVTRVYINVEETQMSAKFGASYKRYTQEVRRWL